MRADPAGNITGFIIGDIPVPLRKKVSEIIMERDPSVEQVAFISQNSEGTYRMDMMGGEFCGNASRTFGLYLALKDRKSGKNTVSVSVSGADDAIDVIADTDNMTAEITLPPPIKKEEVFFEGRNYYTVFFHGIIHSVIPDEEEERNLAESVTRYLTETYDTEAAGIMFLDTADKKMVPWVYVRDTETLIRESSCGTGSVAAACYLDKDETGDFFETICQPGGELTVKSSLFKGEKSYSIGGVISLGEEEITELDLD